MDVSQATWPVCLCVSLGPPGWALLELTYLRGHRVLPVTLHRAGGHSQHHHCVFVCFFSFTCIVTLYLERFLDLQAHKTVSKHSCVLFTLTPHSGFPRAGTQGSSRLLSQRDPIQDHRMTCCPLGSVLSVSLAFAAWTCLNSPVLSQMPLGLGLSDVSSQ